MPRFSGKYGQVKAQGTGVTLKTYQALTGNTAHTEYSAAAADAPWAANRSDSPLIRMDGLISGGSVNPTAVADQVTLEAGTAYAKGTAVTFVDTTISSIAPVVAPGNVLITAICSDYLGVITKVAGVEGVAGGARGAAGGPPYILEDKILLAYITRTTATAVITSAEIDTTAAERADIPSHEINHVAGKVVLGAALSAIHTGDITRKVWAQYHVVTLIVVGDLTDWSLEITTARQATTAGADLWELSVAGQKGASGSAKSFMPNDFWWDLAVADPNDVILELFQDRRTTKRFRGNFALDWGSGADMTKAVDQSLKFKAIGEVVRLLT